MRGRWRIDSEDQPERASLVLPIALTMHRYGWAVPECVEGSVAAMDAMVARIQPRGFERLAPELRPLLESPPEPLKRQPNRPKITTQFRTGDVLSIRHGQHWRGGYVVDISNDKSGMYPVVYFFDGIFDSPPTHAELAACVARGQRLNNGLVYPARHALFGLSYAPDPAGQIEVIASDGGSPPDESHLEKPRSISTFSYFCDLHRILEGLWAS